MTTSGTRRASAFSASTASGNSAGRLSTRATATRASAATRRPASTSRRRFASQACAALTGARTAEYDPTAPVVGSLAAATRLREPDPDSNGTTNDFSRGTLSLEFGSFASVSGALQPTGGAHRPFHGPRQGPGSRASPRPDLRRTSVARLGHRRVDYGCRLRFPSPSVESIAARRSRAVPSRPTGGPSFLSIRQCPGPDGLLVLRGRP